MSITAIVVLALLQVSDAYSTHLVLSKGGYEANPVMRWILDRFGFGGMFVLKGFLVALVIYVEASGMAPVWWFTWALCLPFLYATISNYTVYRGMK